MAHPTGWRLPAAGGRDESLAIRRPAVPDGFGRPGGLVEPEWAGGATNPGTRPGAGARQHGAPGASATNRSRRPAGCSARATDTPRADCRRRAGAQPERAGSADADAADGRTGRPAQPGPGPASATPGGQRGAVGRPRAIPRLRGTAQPRPDQGLHRRNRADSGDPPAHRRRGPGRASQRRGDRRGPRRPATAGDAAEQAAARGPRAAALLSPRPARGPL